MIPKAGRTLSRKMGVLEVWLPKHIIPESVGCFKSPAGTGYICPK